MRLRFAVALGLATVTLVTAGVSAALAAGWGGPAEVKPPAHNCMALTLNGGRVVSGYTVPTVCVIRDTAGKRFYLFSGVFRYVAGRRRVQARFPVSNALPLQGTTIVPVVGFAGTNPSNTYAGYGLVRPDGQITIRGPKPGWVYTVTISGQIPVGIPAGS